MEAGGQDGGETSYVRQGERLESSGNDVANTVRRFASAGPQRKPRRPKVSIARHRGRGLEFILRQGGRQLRRGLAVTRVTNTADPSQAWAVHRHVSDLDAMSELDGSLADKQQNARVRRALEKCTAKIQHNQLQDGSWNVSGVGLPILRNVDGLAEPGCRQAKGRARG